MKSPSRPYLADDNPYLAGPRARPRLRDLLVRMFLIMVPAQFAGYLIGILIAVGSGAFQVPGGGLVINFAAAVTAGLTVGLWTTPEPRSRPACAVLSTGLGAAVAMAVFLGAAARLAPGHVPGPLDFAPGVIITALGQGLIGWLLWMISRPSRQN